MQEKTINLQPVFSMNNHYFIKNMQECFDTLNPLLKSKSGVAENPLYIREGKQGKIEIGYIPKEKGTRPFFCDEVITGEADAMDRAILVQFVIFEACKNHDCYQEVPMCGAPEEGGDAYFTFTYEGISHTYQLWLK